MSVATPLSLLVLLVVPVVALAAVAAKRRRRKTAVRHPAAASFPATRRRALPALMLAAAAVALGVSFAKPQRTVAVPVEKASVVLVTDESGSMSAQDVDPSRIGAAQQAASSFLDHAPDTMQVGFVGFSTQTNAVIQPTRDRTEVKSAIANLTPNGGTATGDALNAALDRLQARKGKDGTSAPAAIVLLSDGKRTEGSDPLTAAARAKKLGIKVSTVALGTADGTVIGPGGEPFSVAPDPGTLRQIASTTGGTFTEAADADQLDGVYKDLGSKIGTRKVKREVSSGFAGAALLLLAGGLGLGLGRRGRLA